MNKFEYIKWFWKHNDDDTPILLFYEIDLENERYATRMVEVFSDKRAIPVIEKGFDYITEEPIPTIDEINIEPEFFAEIISKEEFEAVYKSKKYAGEISLKSLKENFWNQFDSSGGVVTYQDIVLKEDMFQAEYPNGILLDAGYYQDRFKVYVISGNHWEKPLAVYECDTPEEMLLFMQNAVERFCFKKE